MALKLKYDFTKPIWDDADDQIDAQKGPSLDVVRASTAKVTDYFNVIKTVKANEPRFTGGRRVENLITYSEDFSNASWSVAGSGTAAVGIKTPNYGTAPDGTTTACRVQLDVSAGSAGNQSQMYHGYTAPGSKTSSSWIKTNDDSTITMNLVGSGGPHITVTGEWQRHSLEVEGGGATNLQYILIKGITSDTADLLVWHPQGEETSGQDDPSPSEYIATTTAAVSKWYATKRRTNLMLQSEAYSTSPHSLTNTTELTGQSDPDGGTSATQITNTTASGQHRVFSGNTNINTSGPYTQSVYVKDVDAGFMQLHLYNVTTATSYGQNFNLTTGASTSNPSASLPDASSIEDLGDGWYRCSITVNDMGSASNHNFQIHVLEADETTVNKSYVGTEKSILVYGWQLERDSTATDYIATTTTVASSAFDTAITPTGLLVEEARTNLVLRSEEVDNASWTKTNSVIGANSAVAPDGTTTADKMTDNSATGTGSIDVRQAITVVNATQYTVSVFAKADQLDWIWLYMDDGIGNANCYFNVASGAVGTADADAIDPTITDAGNGWYRCSFNFDSTGTGAGIRIYAADADNDITVDLDGTSSIFVWGAQLEAGSFPTSYIPTVAASVTRSADAIETTDVSWLNANAGTLYVKETLHGTTTQDGVFLNDNTNDNLIGTHAAGDVFFLVRVSDTNQANINAGTLTLDTELQVAGAWSANDFAVSLDGASVVTDSAGTIPTVTQFTLASPPAYNNNFHKIHISEIRYYNERLSNTALENMSNGIFPTTGGKSGPSLAFGGMGKMGLRS